MTSQLGITPTTYLYTAYVDICEKHYVAAGR